MLRHARVIRCAVVPQWVHEFRNAAKDFADEELDPYLHVPLDPVETLAAPTDAAFGCVHVANTYAFPDRRQLPTSVGTIPAKLWYDPTVPVPALFVQLGEHIPRDLWLPCKPDVKALHRVMSEFAHASAVHRDKHHDAFLGAVEVARKFMQQQNIGLTGENVLRYVAWLARDDDFDSIAFREFHNHQDFFLGEYNDPQSLIERFDTNPNLFAIPRFRTNVDLTTIAPSVDGPGLATSLYRCVYSKSLIAVQAHLAAEVKLPARDVESFDLLHQDNAATRKFRVPVFARVIWQDNVRMCGGGSLIARFNQTHKNEFAHDMPVDAVAAVTFVADWAKRRQDLLGVRGMRERVNQLIESAPAPLLSSSSYPATADIPSVDYTREEELGMHLQYLARLNDPDIDKWIARFRYAEHASVRIGCAKAAIDSGDRQTFREIVASEPDGRSKHYMTQLVRRRKRRDLTDEQPRLLDEQYEFPAPLWTARGRVDPTTAAGHRSLHRLSSVGKVDQRKEVK